MHTAVKVFRVKGFMKLRGGEKIPFSIETTALTRDHAVEKILYELGSRHKLKTGVKAATYHMLKVERDDGCHVQVLFDI